MGSNINDKWLGKLRDSVENYSEPLPDGFWEDIKASVPGAPAASQKTEGSERFLWTLVAAAVLLLGIVLFLPQDKEDVTGSLAVAVMAEKDMANEDAGADTVEEKISDDKIVVEKVHKGNVQVVKVSAKRIFEEEIVGDVTAVADVVGAGSENKVLNEISGGDKAGKETDVTGNADDKFEHKTENRQTELQTYREEYLKELEYLKEDVPGRRAGDRRFVSFGAGNNRVQLDFVLGFKEAAPAMGDAGSMNGSNRVPDNFASFINMSSQQVENVTWMGENSPMVFNAPQSYKTCSYKHRQPFRTGVSFAFELGRWLYAESGLSYQYMGSAMYAGGQFAENSSLADQKLHYLGIPVKIGVNFMSEKRFQIYLSGGYMVEKCVYGVLEQPNGHVVRLKLKGVMNSVNVTAGMQFKIGELMALYAEPGWYKYLGLGEEIGRQNGYILKNIYTDHPDGISFQGGVRFMF
ncbi:MAG: hypothetical protein IIW25_01365 [Bacteroidales bacterium]|nr:hypothetical protein [Bacteroidales bacterium]